MQLAPKAVVLCDIMTAIWQFKVIEFRTDRNHVCDFLLVINTRLLT